jgi:hypothetical protein
LLGIAKAEREIRALLPVERHSQSSVTATVVLGFRFPTCVRRKGMRACLGLIEERTMLEDRGRRGAIDFSACRSASRAMQSGLARQRGVFAPKAGFKVTRAPANLGHLATLARKMLEAMRPTA